MLLLNALKQKQTEVNPVVQAVWSHGYMCASSSRPATNRSLVPHSPSLTPELWKQFKEKNQLLTHLQLFQNSQKNREISELSKTLLVSSKHDQVTSPLIRSIFLTHHLSRRRTRLDRRRDKIHRWCHQLPIPIPHFSR